MILKAIRSENYKLLCDKWVLLVMAGIVIFIPIMAVTLDSYTGEGGFLLCQSKLMQSFYLGQVGFAVLSSLYFGQEFRQSALRTSLLCAPRRITLLISKTACITAWTTVLLMLSTVLSAIAVYSVFGIQPDTDNISDMIKCLVPAYISSLELVLLTSSAAILTRSLIIPMSVTVSLLLGLGNLLLQYFSVVRYFPAISVMNGFFVSEIPQYLSISAGLLVQGIWCAVMLFISGVVFVKRGVR